MWWKLNRDKSLLFNSIADWCYGIVFLGFVTYQILVFNEIVANFLGGSFTLLLTATFPLLLYQTIRHRSEQIPLNFLRYLWYIFLLNFIVYLIYGYIADVNPIILISNSLALLRFFVMYYIFLEINVDSKAVKNISLIVLMLVFAVVFLSPASIHSNVLEFDDNLLSSSNAFQVDYQTMGALVLIASFIVSEGAKFPYRILIFLITFLALLGCGARFELVAFIVCVIFRELKLLGGVRFFMNSILISMITSIIYLTFYLTSNTLKFSEGFRIFQIVEDGSIGDRWDLFLAAAKTIENNFLFGNYASYEPGAYAHNIISAWVDAGLFGFLILLSIYFSAIYIAFHYYFKPRVVFLSFPFMIVIISVLAAIFSKHYTNMYLPIMIGAVVGYFRRHGEFRR